VSTEAAEGGMTSGHHARKNSTTQVRGSGRCGGKATKSLESMSQASDVLDA